MKMESTVINADAKRADRGQLFALIIALAFLAVAGFLIYEGHETAGTVLGTVDIAGLTSVFISGSVIKRNERQERGQQLRAAQSPRR